MLLEKKLVKNKTMPQTECRRKQTAGTFVADVVVAAEGAVVVVVIADAIVVVAVVVAVAVVACLVWVRVSSCVEPDDHFSRSIFRRRDI